jgi:hypothetical protein
MKQRTKETKRTRREDRVHDFEREMATEKPSIWTRRQSRRGWGRRSDREGGRQRVSGPAEREGCARTGEKGRWDPCVQRNSSWGELMPGVEATVWSSGTGRPRRVASLLDAR